MIDRMNFPIAMLETMKTGSDVDTARPAMSDDEFDTFYERTARPLWAYLSRITGDPHQADDVLQEAYYRFYRAGARHESESHRRNSLFQIATNIVRDAARRGRHYEEVPLEEEPATAPAATRPTPEHQATVRTDVSRALKRLSPEQRELLWLAYAQGSSHEEIAAILGLKAISVRTLLLRARRKFATILTGGKP